MSFRAFINPRDPKDFIEVEALDLLVDSSIWVPGLTQATIPHLCRVQCNGPVILFRKPILWDDKGLWVDTGPVEMDVPIVTHVFNMTNKTVRVRMGECISLLLEWPKMPLPESVIITPSTLERKHAKSKKAR